MDHERDGKPAGAGERTGASGRPSVAVILLLVALPVAVLFDLRDRDRATCRAASANDISKIINDIRGFYANDVVARSAAGRRHQDHG